MKKTSDFDRISYAIEYMKSHALIQPDLKMIAKEVGMSPAHFQKMFTKWAGTSPKKFIQYLSLEYAKEILKKESVLTTSHKSGLSGSGRLHDLFVTIEGMTPGEYKNGGESLKVTYSFGDTQFGQILIASTSKGICYIGFVEDTKELRSRFPNATYIEKKTKDHKKVLDFFKGKNGEIKLHIKGTRFQIKVWEALLRIPEGNLSTYGGIAKKIKHKDAMRAVGTAIGYNPISYIIPCHRVIKSSGITGEYMWGKERKSAMIGLEMRKRDNNI